jgi:hypothetical protein
MMSDDGRERLVAEMACRCVRLSTTAAAVSACLLLQDVRDGLHVLAISLTPLAGAPNAGKRTSVIWPRVHARSPGAARSPIDSAD